MSHSQEASAVAKRTENCLSEINEPNKDEPANVILLLGETGVGKSSLLEYLTGTSGHSEESANSVTEKFEIEKSHIEGKDYYIMDTPGFDHAVEPRVFDRVVEGIQAIGSRARIIGVFLVIPMHHTRFTEMDQKLLRFTQAFCGDEYATQFTVVTTFWDASNERQKQNYNTRLANVLKEVERLWPAQRLINHYQHGREYKDGQDTGAFLDWYQDRNKIAEYAKDFIHRHYGHTDIRDPRIVQELATDPSDHTTAGQYLGLAPQSTPSSTFDPASSSTTATGPNEKSSEKPKQDIPKQESPMKDLPEENPPKPTSSSDRAFRQENGAQTNEKGWTKYLVDGLFVIARDVITERSSRTDWASLVSGLLSSGGSRRPHYNGPVDMNSVVDVFKQRGWDPSPANRAQVVQRLGIVGTPGTAAYNDALRRKVQQFH